MVCLNCESEIPDSSDFCPMCRCPIKRVQAIKTELNALKAVKSAYLSSNTISAYTIIGYVLSALFLIGFFVSAAGLVIAGMPTLPIIVSLIIEALASALYLLLFFGLGAARSENEKLQKRIENLEKEITVLKKTQK